MEGRRARLVELAVEHGPCSVRHLFYRAVVAEMPGITKNDRGYDKVQRAVLELRRSGAIPYELVVDTTRWVRRSPTFDSIGDALDRTAELYRRDLWTGSDYLVEVWCESDSIASTVVDVVDKWTLATMVTRGFSSETFAYNAAEAWRRDWRRPVVLYIGDHDPHGLDIERTLRDRLTEFYGSNEFDWTRIGVTWGQVVEFDLPGTTPKRDYGFDLAVEAEALPPRYLRDLVDAEIRTRVDDDEFHQLELIERAERDSLASLAGMLR